MAGFPEPAHDQLPLATQYQCNGLLECLGETVRQCVQRLGLYDPAAGTPLWTTVWGYGAPGQPPTYPGRTFWLYMLLYAISRFIIEFFRGDERGAVGMFSTSQFISILLAPLAVAMLVYLARRTTPEPKRARKAA